MGRAAEAREIDWLGALRSEGAERDEAIAQLYALLLRASRCRASLDPGWIFTSGIDPSTVRLPEPQTDEALAEVGRDVPRITIDRVSAINYLPAPAS